MVQIAAGHHPSGDYFARFMKMPQSFCKYVTAPRPTYTITKAIHRVGIPRRCILTPSTVRVVVQQRNWHR